jgi:hypothetical protein
MELNDLTDLLMAIPVALGAKWAVWFAFGLGLSIWGRREKMYSHAPATYDDHPYEEHQPAAKPKSGVRSERQPKVAPSSGDAFGELEALLEQQTTGTHRMPGEAPVAPVPVLAEAPAPSPVLAEAPRLAAPQSLP